MSSKGINMILAAVTLLLAVGILVLAGRAHARDRHLVTCYALETEILDSMERRFVSGKDIETFLEDYGPWRGERLEDVDLARMEKLLDSKGAIRESNAWTGDDGVLHVEIYQRAPVIRFQSGNSGWYADASGFIFPLQERFPVRVPVVDGQLPISLTEGFKGYPNSEGELQWLLQMTALAAEMGQFWSERISQINVLPDGELVMIPRMGDERFRFGSPTGVKEKLEKMKLYYQCVAPTRETPYRSVDLRFEGQLVCR